MVSEFESVYSIYLTGEQIILAGGHTINIVSNAQITKLQRSGPQIPVDNILVMIDNFEMDCFSTFDVDIGGDFTMTGDQVIV